MRISAALVAVSVVLLFGVAGCTPDTPPVLPAPESSTAPLFASEEEALAAAEEVYAKFLAVSDLIIAEGGAAPERLLEVITPELYIDELEGVERVASRGWHSTGSTLITSFLLQSYSTNEVAGSAAVVAYVCVDISGVDLIDSAGESVVSASRENLNPFQASFDFAGDDLVLSGNDLWDGGNFCME